MTSRLAPFAPAALAVFRVIVGLSFLTHGTAKLFGFPDGSPVEVGRWPSWYAGVIEVVTGLLVAIGLFTAPAAILAAGTMAVAYFWQHFPESFWPTVNGGETAMLYCFAFLLLAVTGPGAWGVQSVRSRRIDRGSAAQP
ncbi:DoxX family protein [Mycobacterium sp. WMMD1722]|uniref:DoxX family protein n=1 Tax=Mycobacterium sp. WMMD1722 TaxID=3404117 RepID=UPI003BF4CE24